MNTQVPDIDLNMGIVPSGEMAIAERQAREQMAIQAQLFAAWKRPRDTDLAAGRILELCKQFDFADAATYIFPHGEIIKGGSIHMALEVASQWGNMWTAVYVIYSDDERCKIEALAWDFESNQRMTAEDSFRWLIPKKRWYTDKSGKRVSETEWVPCEDEWDRVRLLNNHASRVLRNQIKRIIPHRHWEAFVDRCLVTLETETAAIAKLRPKILAGLKSIKVTEEQLCAWLQKRRGAKRKLKVTDLDPVDVVRLRKIWQSLKDGYTVPGDWFPGASTEPMPKAAANGQLPPQTDPASTAAGVQAGGMGTANNTTSAPVTDEKKAPESKPDPALKDKLNDIKKRTEILKKRNMGSAEHGTQELESRMLAICEAATSEKVDVATVHAALTWLTIASSRLDFLENGKKSISTEVTRCTNSLALTELLVFRDKFTGDLRKLLDAHAAKPWEDFRGLTYIQFRDMVAELDSLVAEVVPTWFAEVRFGPQIVK